MWSQFVNVFDCLKMQRDFKWDVQEHQILNQAFDSSLETNIKFPNLLKNLA